MCVIRILLLMCLYFTFTGIAVAQDSTDYQGGDWDKIINDYNNTQFTKPVSPQEFNKAVDTIKQYQQKPKKKHWWSRKNKEEETVRPDFKPAAALSATPSQDPLLRLPVDVMVNNQVIGNGFYLVSKKVDDGNYYLLLKQGHSVVIELPAQNKGDGDLKSSIRTENVDSKSLKIIYQDKDSTLESIVSAYN